MTGSSVEVSSRICYADDTFFAVQGSIYEEVARRVEVGGLLVTRQIGALWLRVSLTKIDTLCFKGSRWRLPRGACLNIDGEAVEVKAHTKYLGLTLDGSWKLEKRFLKMAPRLVGATGALSRLLRLMPRQYPPLVKMSFHRIRRSGA